MNTVPPLEERTILHVLRKGITQYPDSPAIADETMSLTYQNLWDRATAIAGGLRGIGVDKGDRVLMMLDNSADCFVLLVAASFIGAELVPVNLAWRNDYLAHAMGLTSCVAAVVDRAYLDAITAADATDGHLRTVIVREPNDSNPQSILASDSSWSQLLRSDPVEPIEVGPESTPIIIFTSGTTGRSKGVRTTHAQIFTMCYFSPHAPELGRLEKFYVAAPMFHALALFGGAFAPLIFGGSSYVSRSFSPSRFWDEVRLSGATSTIMVGTMADFLVSHPERSDDGDNPLRVANVVPRPLCSRAFADRFGVAVTTSFGSSEFGTCFVDWSTDPVPHYVGVPRGGLKVRIVDLEGNDVAPGESGELLLQPENRAEFFTEYVNNAEATRAIESSGWFRTGDIFRCDESGGYFYVDRLRDSIRRRGENVSSMEVEFAILSHAGVRECAAIGVGDMNDQEVMIAVVKETGADVTEADLVAHAAERLPYYAIPRYVAFVVDFPRTQTGKVQKATLRDSNLVAWDREEAGIKVARPGR
jgi:crotonobetaine/carnitine-CoA ligase